VVAKTRDVEVVSMSTDGKNATVRVVLGFIDLSKREKIFRRVIRHIKLAKRCEGFGEYHYKAPGDLDFEIYIVPLPVLARDFA